MVAAAAALCTMYVQPRIRGCLAAMRCCESMHCWLRPLAGLNSMAPAPTRLAACKDTSKQHARAFLLPEHHTRLGARRGNPVTGRLRPARMDSVYFTPPRIQRERTASHVLAGRTASPSNLPARLRRLWHGRRCVKNTREAPRASSLRGASSQRWPVPRSRYC